jgi:hypothetical protein
VDESIPSDREKVWERGMRSLQRLQARPGCLLAPHSRSSLGLRVDIGSDNQSS